MPDMLPLVLTLAAYQIGVKLQQKVRSPICNPVLVSVVLVLALLRVTGWENADYQAGMTRISWLMTPATICLAIPMYQQFQILRKNLPMIVAGVAAGAISCLAVVLVFAAVFKFDTVLTISLLPKSVTTAIGVPLSGLNGGIQAVTTAAIVLTGILASVLGPALCRLFRLTDPVAQGVAFGTAGHVIGTSKANELGQLTGAVSSLSLVVAGLLTAVVFPIIVGML